MRAIRVWRWSIGPAQGKAQAEPYVLPMAEERIDVAYRMLLSAWHQTGGNGLPAPEIIETDQLETKFATPAGVERFTTEQIVELGTCQDCDSRVMLERLAFIPFGYRAVTIHDPTCPAHAQMKRQAAQQRKDREQ